jgi:hypothetical protein
MMVVIVERIVSKEETNPVKIMTIVSVSDKKEQNIYVQNNF